jgi:uncharacterized lipoprotein YmbA
MILFAMATTMLAISGCGGSKPARFYLLQSTTVEEQRTSRFSVEDVTVCGVLPLDLPDYLRRPQIATRTEGNRLDYAEFDRWAEPLVDTIARIVSATLEAELPGCIFLHYPWAAQLEPRCRISLAFDQFDLYEDGSAVVKVQWAIGEGRSGQWAQRGCLHLTETFEEDKKADYSARVDALNRLIYRMNQRLAAELQTYLGEEAAR